MKRSYIIALLLLALLTACGTSAQGQPKGEGAGTDTPYDNGLLADASPETSALSLYEWDGSTLTMHTLYETDYVKEILRELREVPTSEVTGWTPEQLGAPVYGLWISKTDGTPLEAAWSGGVWIDRDGRKYSFDFPFHELLDRYAWADDTMGSQAARYVWEDETMGSLAAMPCARYLAEQDGAWYPGFMSLAEEPVPPEGVSMTLTAWTPEALTVTFSNRSGREWEYGTYFSLEVELDGAFYTVPNLPGTNWAFEDIGIILPDGEDQTRTYSLSPYGDLPAGRYRISACGLTAPFTVGQLPLEDYQKPPALTVSCGEGSVPASGTTYSWTYPNGDGTASGVEADGRHPLDMLEDMPPLTVDEGGDVALTFELPPDEITVACWPEEVALEPGENGVLSHLEEATELPVENGHVTVPTDGGYIFEVWAKWNGTNCGGNACFGFRTAAGSGEEMQEEPEPPSTMPLPLGRDPETIRDYLATFPNSFQSLSARQDALVLDPIGEEKNRVLWDRFAEKVESGEEAAVVVIAFTVEGDGIPMYLHYDGTDIYMMEDTTRDTFGSGGYFEKSFTSLADVAASLGIAE